MAIIIKFLLSDIEFASRDKKEISLLKEIGHDLIVVCYGKSEERIASKDGYKIQYIRRPDISYSIPKPIRVFRILNHWLHISFKIREIKSDCISCHDLIALLIGWVSTWFIPKNKRPLLVYDSHEFEAGRNSKRGKLATWLTVQLEKFLIKRASLSIMVSNSIADEVQKLHNLKVRPTVVRNVAPQWNIDKEVCKVKRKEFCNSLGVPEETFIVMYHGGVMEKRGVENLIRAISRSKDIVAVILGYGEKEYLKCLKELAIKLKVDKRILFHPAVSYGILWQYIGAVDLGTSIIENDCVSYFYSLPNKLFENIQSETPVLGSNFPEIQKIIDGYKIGLCCNPNSIEDIVRSINTIKSNKEIYNSFKNNLKIAKKELCWEKEKKILSRAYGNIFR